MHRYAARCGGRFIEAESLAEAVSRAARECSGEQLITVYRVVAELAPAEAADLAGQHGGGRVEVEEHGSAGAPGRLIVVFDQMFKGFAEVLERETSSDVELHEIVGRGLESTIRASERVYKEPARDDYDVLKLVERLSAEAPVLFFTGDKRLAAQARTLKGVKVVYLPPGEVTGKEMAIRRMLEEIKKLETGSRR